MRRLGIVLLALTPFTAALADAPQDCLQTEDIDRRIAACTALIRSSPADAGAYHNRGWAYWTKGDYNLAIADYDRALRLNPRQAASWNNRGLAYYMLQQYARAAVDFNEALRLEPAHPMAGKNLALTKLEIDKIASTDQAANALSIAQSLHRSGHLRLAEDHYAAAIKEAERENNPIANAAARSGLGAIYTERARFRNAETLYQRALSLRERALGPKHADVGRSLHNLAYLHAAEKKRDLAEPLYNRALAILKASLGAEHEDVALTLNGLAELYLKNGGGVEPALPLLTEALRILEIVHGPEHADIARVLRNLGDAYGRATNLQDSKKAETLLLKALHMQEALLGPDDPEVAETLFELVSVHRHKWRSAEAEALNARALKLANIRQNLIVYGTNRRLVESKDGWLSTYQYADEASDRVRFGSAMVAGTSDQALARSERRADGLDLSSRPLSSAQRFDQKFTSDGFELEQLGYAYKGRPVLFVHGFNVSFEEALKQSAQIFFDLDYPGGFSFMWPSGRGLGGYFSAQTQVARAAEALVEFLDALQRRIPSAQFNLIGHSMGGEVVLGALERIAGKADANRRQPFAEVVLAHPDVDAERLARGAQAAKVLSAKVTVYSSRDDRAMWISRLVNWSSRTGGTVTSLAGVDTIDITGLGAGFLNLNHSVYVNNPILFGDLSRLLDSSTRPVDARTALFTRESAGSQTYWHYVPAGAPAR